MLLLLVGRASPPEADANVCFDSSGRASSFASRGGVVEMDVSGVLTEFSLSFEVLSEDVLSEDDTRVTHSAWLEPFGAPNLRRTAGAGRSGRRKKSATTAFRGKVVSASGLRPRLPKFEGDATTGKPAEMPSVSASFAFPLGSGRGVSFNLTKLPSVEGVSM